MKFTNDIHEVSPFHWVHRQKRVDGNHKYSARVRCGDGGVHILSVHDTAFMAKMALYDLLAEVLPPHQ